VMREGRFELAREQLGEPFQVIRVGAQRGGQEVDIGRGWVGAGHLRAHYRRGGAGPCPGPFSG